MLTGTPLDLTPFGSILQGIGVAYWLLVLGLISLVLYKVKGWKGKLVGSTAVLVISVLPIAYHAKGRLDKREAAKARLAESRVLFEQRCRSAGERVSHYVENVVGVVWMRWRDNEPSSSDQFTLDDPYGRDCSMEGCIRQLLRPSNISSYLDAWKGHVQGFGFVETIDPRDGRSYRYSAIIKKVDDTNREEFQRSVESTGYGAASDGTFISLARTPVDRLSFRYGIKWDDISTREDREHWIAGGSLQIIDLSNGAVIAERIGYLIDTGQGSTAGFRSPWSWAKAYAPRCPKLDESASDFGKRVLKPIKGE